MHKKKKKATLRGWSAAVIAAGLATAVSFAQESDPWGFLPARVLEIEGGLVAFRGAVIVDTSETPSPLVKYPTKYILPVTNEAEFPIWVDVEWQVPGQKPFKSAGNLDPGKFGAFFVKTKEVAWNTPIPVQTTIYADAAKTRKVGGREVALFFGDGPDKDAFLKLSKETNTVLGRMADASRNDRQMPLLVGFQEMAESGAVPGTSVDDTLNHDIRLLLWRHESRHHWDCAHDILGAAAFDPQGSTEFAALPEDQRQRVLSDVARGDTKLETWQVKSCDMTTPYLLIMSKSPQGGTDVMAVPLGPAGPH